MWFGGVVKCVDMLLVLVWWRVVVRKEGGRRGGEDLYTWSGCVKYGTRDGYNMQHGIFIHTLLVCTWRSPIHC
jgi:hypothetical protein